MIFLIGSGAQKGPHVRRVPHFQQGIAFLKQYWEDDIYIAHFRSGSISEWAISPPARAALLNDLKNDTDVVMHFNWQFRRCAKVRLDEADD